MSAKKAPAAPPSPVDTAQNQATYGSAGSNIGQVAQNPFPMQTFNTFAPGLQSTNPYGFSPEQATQQGQFMAGQGQNMYGAGNQLLQTGFDPQNALYDRTRQQVQDQARISQASRGIQTTPYGAGLENQNMSNFNIDWQNQQLQRQLAASQGAGAAYGAGGNQILGGQGLAASIPQIMSQYAGGVQQLGMNAFAPQQWAAPQYENLFGLGTGAQNQAYQNQLGQFNANQQSQAGLFGGLGKLGGTLLTAPMTGGGSLFGNLFTH